MVNSSQSWWNVSFLNLFQHQFCFTEDKVLILLRWSFVVAETRSLLLHVDVSVCLRYVLWLNGDFLPYKSLLRNHMLFVLKDIWTSSTNCSTTETRRFSEPVRGIWPTGSSTERASRDSPRRSVFRYCDGFEGQWKYISLHFASKWDGVKWDILVVFNSICGVMLKSSPKHENLKD